MIDVAGWEFSAKKRAHAWHKPWRDSWEIQQAMRWHRLYV